MPGTRTDYGQMYDHMLNPRRGYSLEMGANLEKVLPVMSGQDEKVYAGCVMHIDATDASNLKFSLGTAASTNAAGYVPFLAMKNEDDYDVNPTFGNTSGGGMLGLCCLGAYEVDSTEFEADTFSQGSWLTSTPHTASDDLDATGKLSTGTIGTHEICGVISEVGPETDGSFTNEHNKPTIRFYTCWYPSILTAE